MVTKLVPGMELTPSSRSTFCCLESRSNTESHPKVVVFPDLGKQARTVPTGFPTPLTGSLVEAAHELDLWRGIEGPSTAGKAMAKAKAKGPIVAVSDWVAELPNQIREYIPNQYIVLGTDGFGRSDTRKNLRKFFEVDKEHVAAYGLSVLAKEQLIASKYTNEAIKKYKIDINKPMPTKL